MNDLAYAREVVILDSAPQSIGEQLFSYGGGELFGMTEQYFAKLHRAIEFRAIRQNSGRIDRCAALGRSPLANDVEVFERKPQRIHSRMANRTGRIRAMLFHPLPHGQDLAALRILLFER